MSALNIAAIVRAIHYGETFSNSTGSLRGDYAYWYPSTGRLPRGWVERLRADYDVARAEGSMFYVVYSYATPIAWGREGDLLTVPDVRYSVTTSRHQSAVLGGYVPGHGYVTNGQRIAA